MTWNWELADWPNFEWDRGALDAIEAQVMHHAGFLVGTSMAFEGEDRDLFRIEILCDEAMKTSWIEGEILDRESVQSSLRKFFGLRHSSRRIPPRERGMAEMVIDLHRTWNEPLATETLFRWHSMTMSGRRDLEEIGRFRTHEESMHVVSGNPDRPKVHFVAPPSDRVVEEMTRFVEWFNASAPGGSIPLRTQERAGLAHLYFVAIHPFEDGNGRIARALSERALFQGVGHPILASVSLSIADRRTEYYGQLQKTNSTLEATDWLIWFGNTVLAALQRSKRMVECVLFKTRLLTSLRGRINARQEKALVRMFREGLEGFKGGLSADNYIKITGASRSTATRDLQHLVSLGALIRSGVFRHTRYRLDFPE